MPEEMLQLPADHTMYSFSLLFELHRGPHKVVKSSTHNSPPVEKHEIVTFLPYLRSARAWFPQSKSSALLESAQTISDLDEVLTDIHAPNSTSFIEFGQNVAPTMFLV